MAVIGYMRVSTHDQTHGLQEDALKKYGCDRIYSDTISGKTTNRVGLDEVLENLDSGDTLVVWKLDRLGRKTIHLLQTIEDLEERGVGFVSLMEGFDATTTAGKLMFQMMCACAEFERNNLRDRVIAGVRSAQARGVHCGRRSRFSEDDVFKMVSLRKSGLTVGQVADIIGEPKSTVAYATRGRL